jgi:hypothetical protein
MKVLLLLILLCSQLFAQSNDFKAVQELLDLDRFHAYTQSWAHTMAGRDKKEIAKIVLNLKPTEIAAMKLPAEKFTDAFHYDELILKILHKKHPSLNVTKEEVAWGYDFYKRKLNAAYKIAAPTASMDPKAAAIITPGHSGGLSVAIDPANIDDVLLNVDSYVSGRTTRAVFWEASASNRKIELHVGSGKDFKDNLAQRGAKVLGEIKTHANNYNPIYIVQDPGAKSFHYAVTEISGSDRLKHFQMQSSLVRWEKNLGKLAPPPPVQVIGDALAKFANEEATLTQVLKVVPKADHVVIGQKGAFDRTVRSLGKIHAVLELAEKNPAALKMALSAEHYKLVEKALANKDELTSFVMKNASPVDKLYEAAQDVLLQNKINLAPNPAVYNLDRGTYEVSDYMLQGKNGKVQRWRVFSNVWGDEVLPIANSLKATGHSNVVYIGTAGALPESGLKVGDLVVPKKSHDIAGVVRELDNQIIPAGAKKVDMVTHVSSPFEETTGWLAERKKIAQLVEVETGYLAKVFNGPNDRMSIMLLVSDMVGVEGETLAEASSAIRRKAQINALSSVLDEAKVSRPLVTSLAGDKLGQWLDELAPTRDPVSRFQAYKAAEARGISTKEELAKFLDNEKGFTTKRLITSLEEADARLAKVLDGALDAGIRPSIALNNEFLEGRWNPANGPIKVNLQVANPQLEEELKKLISALKKEDKQLAKFLDLSLTTSNPGKEWIKLPGLLDSVDGSLFNLYKDSAIGFGGLAITETRTGNIKFVQVAPPTKGKAVANLAYFAPDEATDVLLKKFATNTDEVEKVLIKHINEMNDYYSGGKNWEIKFSKVKDLPEGALASIVPELGADKLHIHVKMTPEGLKNPAVVLEEIVHLHQITHPPIYVSGGAFTHPYEWAETVANAKAGSPRAMERLARLELEAIRASSDKLSEIFSSDLDFNADEFKKYFQAREAHAEVIYKDVSKLAKADMKKRKAAWDEMKTVFDQMEKEPVKFNDLVAKNDRKGVRKMLEKYLPWDVMEPSETHAWKNWLDAIETPDPSKTKVMFRGMDGDILIKTADGKPGMLSTVLTKNQGNYTRRLRSLATLRERIGTSTIQGTYAVKGVSNGPSLLTAMSKHSYDPVGSPFLSVSNLDIAENFSTRSMAAMLIDERRLVPNAMAWDFTTEVERLVPLVVFPDEVIHFEAYEEAFHRDDFIKKVEKNLGRKLKEHELLSAHYQEEDFIKDGYKRVKALMLDSSSLPAMQGCMIDGKSCACVFKTLNALLK